MLGVPIDLSRIDTDTYIVAGIADHITPWQSCYPDHAAAWRQRTVHPVDQRPHRRVGQSAGQPQGQLPGEQGAPRRPRRVAHDRRDPAGHLVDRTCRPGWPSAAARRPAPEQLGGGGLRPLVEAPGTYVFDS